MNFKNFFIAAPLCLGLLFSCSEEDAIEDPNPDGETYTTEVRITDAPIDNANVEAAFVTIATVEVNGKTLEGFQKTTVELSSLQNGNTKLLGELELEAGTISDIVLTLDNETDAQGETPGSYILTVNGEKKALGTATSEITLTDEVEIEASEENQIILDFDLRKAIVADESTGGYSFAAELSNSVRAVNSLHTGIISGEVTEMEVDNSEKVIVYAYQKGAFNASETEGESGARFSNAVSSSVVSDDTGAFSLHFMEAGDYELHFASYSDADSDGSLEFSSMLEATSTGELALNALSVSAGAELALEVIIIGVLSL